LTDCVAIKRVERPGSGGKAIAAPLRESPGHSARHRPSDSSRHLSCRFAATAGTPDAREGLPHHRAVALSRAFDVA
jgi:hypothetical protein